MMDHKIRDKIIEKAISLEKYGVNDLAWSREDALNLNELACRVCGKIQDDPPWGEDGSVQHMIYAIAVGLNLDVVTVH